MRMLKSAAVIIAIVGGIALFIIGGIISTLIGDSLKGRL